MGVSSDNWTATCALFLEESQGARWANAPIGFPTVVVAPGVSDGAVHLRSLATSRWNGFHVRSRLNVRERRCMRRKLRRMWP